MTPTLLVTRPRPQCAAWLARLAALGVPAAALPLIEIRPADAPAPVQAAWQALADTDLAVFVSPNAVEQFFAQATGRGWPARPLATLRRLAEGFEPRFSLLALLLAVAATLSWLALVRWRTARHRHALWKSLALPAGGVALGWLLVMSLLLPPLDYARSLVPLVARLDARIPADANCLAASGQNLATLAALEWHGGWQVEGRADLARTACRHAIISTGMPTPPGWRAIAQVKRPTDRSGNASLVLLQRQ